jgi:stearoyl-CoA desaturase (delta-9 desaturase)
VTGHGLSVGYHRLFAHRSFRPARWPKVVLAVAGSLAAEGSVISWVALHRQRHVYADRSGDPHSPVVAASPGVSLKGLFHAHVGWLFAPQPSDAERFCPELLADPDIVRISALAPLWLGVSLALPFLLGWAISGTLYGAWLALLWAGAVRIALVHHVTCSVNALGHTFGRRPFRAKDRSGNIWILALVSFGDSWHNNHHAYPALARHGLRRSELDSSAALIRFCEWRGWATHVRWPRPELLTVDGAAG